MVGIEGILNWWFVKIGLFGAGCSPRKCVLAVGCNPLFGMFAEELLLLKCC